MKTKSKKIAAAIYWLVCIFLATGEPKEGTSMTRIILYYAIVLSNLAWATILINGYFKKENATTTN